jgi:hypothetical protein
MRRTASLARDASDTCPGQRGCPCTRAHTRSPTAYICAVSARRTRSGKGRRRAEQSQRRRKSGVHARAERRGLEPTADTAAAEAARLRVGGAQARGAAAKGRRRGARAGRATVAPPPTTGPCRPHPPKLWCGLLVLVAGCGYKCVVRALVVWMYSRSHAKTAQLTRSVFSLRLMQAKTDHKGATPRPHEAHARLPWRWMRRRRVAPHRRRCRG